MTSNFIMSGTAEVEGEFLYGRYGNPSRHAAEAILASLENAKYALAFSSGNFDNAHGPSYKFLILLKSFFCLICVAFYDHFRRNDTKLH